jgi:branched-chain amino acid transport system ATP-binding protein
MANAHVKKAYLGEEGDEDDSVSGKVA